MIGALLASHSYPTAVTWDILAEIAEILPSSITISCTDPDIWEFCIELRDHVEFLEAEEVDSLDPTTVVALAEEEAHMGPKVLRTRVRGVVIVTDDPERAAEDWRLPAVSAREIYVPVVRVGGNATVHVYRHGEVLWRLGLREGKTLLPPDYKSLRELLWNEFPYVRTIGSLAQRTNWHEVLVRLALIEEWIKGNKLVSEFLDWIPKSTKVIPRDSPTDGSSGEDLLEGRLILIPAFSSTLSALA
ncbi:hypothetical protein [Methanopyrus kandleri]